MANLIEKKVFVKNLLELKDKEAVSGPFLVKHAAVGTDKNGKSFMNFVFMDKTGELEGRLWDDVPRYSGQVLKDTFVWIEGKCQSYQGRKQIVISKMLLLREDEVVISDYVTESTVQPEKLFQTLSGYVKSMSDPFYRALAEAILLEDAEIVEKIKIAPAAKSVHHAYRGGLLEHVVSICGVLDGLSKHYGNMVNRDLLLLGGFFHDIGKLWELHYERVTDYTTEGKLIGHLVMGVELIERKINEIDEKNKILNTLPGEFPVHKKLLVKHLILAHHGEYEYGSPKRPKTLEALIVHYIDDLDSKINAIHGFIKADQMAGDWTALNKMYERYFYKGEQ